MRAVTDGIRAWWRSLADEPQPRLPGEKLAAWIVTLFTAATRWLALSRTPWDWDEALFIAGLRKFDVLQHHPHPPGFPLFLGTAKLFLLAGLGEFHALQAVSLVAAVAIVPAMVFMGRELRLPFSTALVSGVFLAFFPNVWFFGGTAFSDVPSMTLVVLSIGLLLRGCRSNGAFFAGAVVLGIAAGFRTQNLAVGFAPAAIASLRGLPRQWLRPLAAFVAIFGIVAISYGAAAHLSGGWGPYSEAIRAHEQYIRTVDSFRSPLRPPLSHLFVRFFVWPYRSTKINVVVTTLVAISVAVSLFRARGPQLALLAAFLPLCVMAWLLLDNLSTSRFSIGYAPLFAVLAADGLSLLSRSSRKVEGLLAAALAVAMITWTWPALREVHSTESPPWAASKWARDYALRHHARVLVHGSMGPFADVLLGDVPVVRTGDEVPFASSQSRRGDIFLIEAQPPTNGVRMFRRPHGRLGQLVRERYFEVAAIPLEELVSFREGWYDEEGGGGTNYRWMGRRGRILLPPIEGRAELRLRLYVPLDALHVPPTIEVRCNGALLGRVVARTPEVELSYSVEARRDAPSELVIETDGVINPLASHLGGDPRDLGVRANEVVWIRGKSEE